MRTSVKRNVDIIDQKSFLVEVIKLANFPISMGCTAKSKHSDIFVDQIWAKSDTNGVYQLANLVELDLLYAEQHDAGVVGNIWMQHHKKFSEFISSRIKPQPILEIGGAHGILSVETSSSGFIDWTIIEPAPLPVEHCKATFIKGFFEENYEKGHQNVIVHSHVLEHIYDPLKFLQLCYNKIGDDGEMLFSIPNIFEMVKRKYSNSINFEHTIFLSENILYFLLSKTGFEIQKKEYFHDDHSIFYHCKKVLPKMDVPLTLEDEYDNIFREFWKDFKIDATALNESVKEVKDPVYLFGAHIFSQILLTSGLEEKYVNGILDNSSTKQGNRLYGTHLQVCSPIILKQHKYPKVVLRAGKYNDEIRQQLLGINPNTTIF